MISLPDYPLVELGNILRSPRTLQMLWVLLFLDLVYFLYNSVIILYIFTRSKRIHYAFDRWLLGASDLHRVSQMGSLIHHPSKLEWSSMKQCCFPQAIKVVRTASRYIEYCSDFLKDFELRWKLVMDHLSGFDHQWLAGLLCTSWSVSLAEKEMCDTQCAAIILLGYGADRFLLLSGLPNVFAFHLGNPCSAHQVVGDDHSSSGRSGGIISEWYRYEYGSEVSSSGSFLSKGLYVIVATGGGRLLCVDLLAAHLCSTILLKKVIAHFFLLLPMFTLLSFFFF